MRVTSPNFEHEGTIPGEFAFAVPDPDQHVALSQNRNPQLNWEDVPEGTQSFVVCCIDDDAPTKPDDVNQEGREVPADLARAEFVHWLLANLPAATRQLDAGAWSEGVTAGGKARPPSPLPGVQGENDYTGWFAGDADMAGSYQGYDGPCPPWNDARVHRYHFSVFALDCATLDLAPGFGLGELRAAMEGHVLAMATLTGHYTLNPRLREA